MKLIKNWKRALKAYSTQALTAAAAIPGIWAMVPEEVKVFVPADKMAIVTAIVAAGGLAGRFIDQRKAEEKDADELVEAAAELAKEKGRDALLQALRRAAE